MKRKIGSLTCILLIASLTLLGCKSENTDLQSESKLHTEVASEQESEKISTENRTTEEISTENGTTEEFSTQELNTETENKSDTPAKDTDSSDSQNTASNQGSNNNTNQSSGNTNASQPTPEQNAPQQNAPQQNAPQQNTPQQSAPEQPAPEPEPEPVPQAPYFNEAYEQAVLNQVNQVRQGLGLPALTLNTTLVNAAHTRSMEIVEQFSHTRPDGRDCFTAWDDAGVSYFSAGENIAAGQQTPEEVMEDWINSPGHYANIVNENFTELSVGCYYVPGSMYGYYWVQCFNTPR